MAQMNLFTKQKLSHRCRKETHGYLEERGGWIVWWTLTYTHCSPGGSDRKESAHNAWDLGSILGLGRSPGEGNGSPL